MTDKIIRFTGARYLSAEHSEFLVKNLLPVFRQIDEIKGRTHAASSTIGSDRTADHGDPGDHENGPGAA